MAAKEYNRRYYLAHRADAIRQATEWNKANPELRRRIVNDRMDRIRAQVFGHYGTACKCCGRTDRLSIDHIAGGGKAHRAQLPVKGTGVWFYNWLIKQGFPEGYQTLCQPCNRSKSSSDHCRLIHA